MTRRGSRAPSGLAALVAAGCLVGASLLSGAAAAPASLAGGARPAEFCIPIILPCHDADAAPAPSPSPSGSPSSTPGDLLDPTTPAAPGSPQPGATTPPAVAPVADDGAPVFTQPSAQLGSKSLSFRGLKAISVVTVPRADGSRVTALKLEADRITISGFSLTVRHETGPILTTTADEMTLDGHVAVYVNSLTATLPGGQPLTLGADTPPPAEGLESLLGVTLGLVGSTADSITYTNTVQQLTE
ncbi:MULTISPECIES: hypothetical protein [unclassified Microbacterium]|uniref:hypothetical protein n=1 Tax=unclassified Microbacterium TaxID=2609290 RepID=UPI003018ADBC